MRRTPRRQLFKQGLRRTSGGVVVVLVVGPFLVVVISLFAVVLSLSFVVAGVWPSLG